MPHGEFLIDLDDLIAQSFPAGLDGWQSVRFFLGVDEDIVPDIAPWGYVDADNHRAEAKNATRANDRIVHRRLEADETAVADETGAVHQGVMSHTNVSADIDRIR